MAAQESPRLLNDDDIICRKLDPGTWKADTLEVLGSAYRDRHTCLSLYVTRYKSPEAILGWFADSQGIKDSLGVKELTAALLYDHGYGVGAVRVGDLRRLGLSFERNKKGQEIGKNGHVNVQNGQEAAVVIASVSRALTSREIFPLI